MSGLLAAVVGDSDTLTLRPVNKALPWSSIESPEFYVRMRQVCGMTENVAARTKPSVEKRWNVGDGFERPSVVCFGR